MIPSPMNPTFDDVDDDIFNTIVVAFVVGDRCFENGDDSSEASEAITAVTIVEFWIRCVSASLSVLVGVVWLVLLTMGKLEDVFG